MDLVSVLIGPIGRIVAPILPITYLLSPPGLGFCLRVVCDTKKSKHCATV